MIDSAINEELFWELVNATSVGKSHPGATRESKTLKAAYLYLVDGGRSKAACGKLAGVSRSTATSSINRLLEVLHDPNRANQRICFDIPKGAIDAVKAAVDNTLAGHNG